MTLEENTKSPDSFEARDRRFNERKRIIKDRITQLRAEREERGDLEWVAVCDRALEEIDSKSEEENKNEMKVMRYLIASDIMEWKEADDDIADEFVRHWKERT